MTSQLWKNRQIIRANMHRPKRCEMAAWGASLILAFAPAIHAADPPAPSNQPAIELPATAPKTAAERWQRLKAQYESQAGTTSESNARPGSFRLRQSASEKDDGALAVPEGLTIDDIAVQSDQKPAAGTQLPPTPNDTVRPESFDARVEDTARRGGRPIDLSGPARNATQVRKISDISPLSEYKIDNDIREYAAEKAREINVKFGGETYSPRNFPAVAMQWTAPEAYYYPLYFQDPALERYGHKHHPLLQPWCSVGRFAGQLVLMPYQMTIMPPWEMQTALGYYRPGDVVPKLVYPFPWNTRAAAVEAATITGLWFLIP